LKLPLKKTGLNVQFDGAGKIVGLDDGHKIVAAMGGSCGACGGRGEAHAPEGNGLGGNNVAGAGMSLNDIARAIAYGSQGLADPRDHRQQRHGRAFALRSEPGSRCSGHGRWRHRRLAGQCRWQSGRRQLQLHR
jgi:hypothetical protein